jgi:two-component system KDP operon response regulator KdpE
MSSASILIVDDEPPIRRYLKTILETQGYEITLAGSGHEALAQIAGRHPDVVLLDLGLPELDGLEVCRRVRAWSDVPIIVLSVRDDDTNKVAALDLGADDYLTKPFSTSELLARVKVALRHGARNQAARSATLRIGELQIDLAQRQVTRSGKEIHLTPTEYELFKTLVQHSGQVLTHATLLRTVWGANTQQDQAKLWVFINQLRRKIEDDPTQPHYIITESGVGYRFCGEHEA